MRISDWSSDVCSSDLPARQGRRRRRRQHPLPLRGAPRSGHKGRVRASAPGRGRIGRMAGRKRAEKSLKTHVFPTFLVHFVIKLRGAGSKIRVVRLRSEEHTSELQSLMRISYAVFCLKKKIQVNSNLRT